MDVISRADAIAQGLDTYFTGKPCKHGGVAPRRTSNYQCLCAACREKEAASARRYYEANKDSVLEYRRGWAKRNEERVRRRKAERYQENRETIKERVRLYRERFPDKVREAQRTSYRKKREQYLEKARIRADRNRERLSRMVGAHLSQEDLRALIAYSPVDGVFRWRKSPGSRELLDGEAGTVMRTSFADYRVITITVDGIQRRYLAHRLAFLYMNGALPNYPEEVVDHIDGNGLNNKWGNLRITDHIGNSRNQKISVRNTSGVTGVSWDKSVGAYQVYITVRGKKIHLGYADDLQEAAIMRRDAERRFGFHENHGRRT